MLYGKIATMLCALFAAVLVTIGSVLAPPVSAPSISFAEAPPTSLPVSADTPVEPHAAGTLLEEVRSDKLEPDFEALSVVTTAAMPAGNPSLDKVGSLHPMEAQLLSLLNEERLRGGLESLQLDDRLVLLARSRSSDMAQRNYFSHVTPEGAMVFESMDEQGVTYLLAGENLARNGYAPEKSAEVAHKGFMNSPSHRENETEPSFDRVGIGVAFSDNGTIYFTELFIASR